MELCVDTCPIVTGLLENVREVIIQKCAAACLNGTTQMQRPICGSNDSEAKNVAVKAAIAASRTTELSTV